MIGIADVFEPESSDGIDPEIVYYDLSGGQPGSAADPTKRLSLTGPCSIDWRDGRIATLDARTGPTN